MSTSPQSCHALHSMVRATSTSQNCVDFSVIARCSLTSLLKGETRGMEGSDGLVYTYKSQVVPEEQRPPNPCKTPLIQLEGNVWPRDWTLHR